MVKNYCPHCGGQNINDGDTCAYCGYVFPVARENPVPEEKRMEPYPTGGLLAWSIITLLLCMIPGIVALVKVAGINAGWSREQQEQQARSVKNWCLAGTILGAVPILIYIVMLVAAILNWI